MAPKHPLFSLIFERPVAVAWTVSCVVAGVAAEVAHLVVA